MASPPVCALIEASSGGLRQSSGSLLLMEGADSWAHAAVERLTLARWAQTDCRVSGKTYILLCRQMAEDFRNQKLKSLSFVRCGSVEDSWLQT